jgi:hypothetical protein
MTKLTRSFSAGKLGNEIRKFTGCHSNIEQDADT